jgi:hypothetical protein
MAILFSSSYCCFFSYIARCDFFSWYKLFMHQGEFFVQRL